ncbi:MAG TPA: nucleoside-diphosphate sugar epimerase/dehydratase [Anaerolineales bacterium]|nr:nucleoside-diphosphate sugar epimerase/dehydratase [Anaerolineales bacterium]
MVPPRKARPPHVKSRFQIRNRFILVGDLILIFTSALASFALRLDLGVAFLDYLPSAWVMLGLALAVKPVVYYLFGMYRRYWVYASIRELRLIAAATTTASVVVALFVLLLRSLGGLQAGFPRAVLGIDWLLSLFSVGGLRLTVRLLAESGQVSQKGNGVHRNREVVVVGAGDAGALVVREMQRNPQLSMKPVAFVDDDPEKLKKEIYGVRVAGSLADLEKVLRRYYMPEVVISIPTAPGSVVRTVIEICRRNAVPFRTMPGMYELIGGQVSVSRLRQVDISDLLRREPAHIDDEAVGRTLSGKRVLVTGAGGSIGLELCRQVLRWGPARLGILGHGENSIFEALLDLKQEFPDLEPVPIIADIRDIDRIREVFSSFLPEVVFHAAAHKHVPLMEINVEEAATNNVLGTKSVVDAALAFGAERFVHISTDKAVQPTSVYGATKRISELIVQDAALRSGLPYVSVRFGNVLGSRGSMVPRFQRQIARGGPVTITHPDMERFFMTIPEAVHLVLQAAGMGQGGELFVLRMGEQVRVLDLAEDLIRLSGLEPGKDIEIVYTGVRPGEKLSESLWDEGIEYEETLHPDIVSVMEGGLLEGQPLLATIDELVQLAQEGDPQAIVGLLAERVPGNRLGEAPPPDLTSVV